MPAFTPAEAGTRFNDPVGMQGWIDLLRESGPGIEPATCQSQVQRPTAEAPRKQFDQCHYAARPRRSWTHDILIAYVAQPVVPQRHQGEKAGGKKLTVTVALIFREKLTKYRLCSAKDGMVG